MIWFFLGGVGFHYFHQGIVDEAMSLYNKALAINPGDAEAYTGRGATYDRKGLHDQAIADYNKALEINPKLAEAYVNRGIVYALKLGDKKKGCSDWRRACELGLCDYYERAKRQGTCE